MMNTDLEVEQLLRWRLARAEAGAPRAPSGSRLLELARPWWESWPGRFAELAGQVGRVQADYGYAMAAPDRAGGGHPVPALVVTESEELTTCARILYFNIRDGRLRLRFRLDETPARARESFGATFVTGEGGRPLLSAQAALSLENEYRTDTEIPEELAREWEPLRVTDRMPFRLILRDEEL